jgi:hypothetical protein
LGVFGVGAKDLLRATRSNQAVEDMDEDLVDSVECLFKARHSAYLYRLELYLQCHHRTADSIWSVGVHFFISSQADPAHAIDIVSHGRQMQSSSSRTANLRGVVVGAIECLVPAKQSKAQPSTAQQHSTAQPSPAQSRIIGSHWVGSAPSFQRPLVAARPSSSAVALLAPSSVPSSEVGHPFSSVDRSVGLSWGLQRRHPSAGGQQPSWDLPLEAAHLFS